MSALLPSPTNSKPTAPAASRLVSRLPAGGWPAVLLSSAMIVAPYVLVDVAVTVSRTVLYAVSQPSRSS